MPGDCILTEIYEIFSHFENMSKPFLNGFIHFLHKYNLKKHACTFEKPQFFLMTALLSNAAKLMAFVKAVAYMFLISLHDL